MKALRRLIGVVRFVVLVLVGAVVMLVVIGMFLANLWLVVPPVHIFMGEERAKRLLRWETEELTDRWLRFVLMF